MNIMSGARALASARRRRASAEESSRKPSNIAPVPSSAAGSSSLSGASLTSMPPPTPPQKMNPATMLLNHDQVLKNLQTVVENLNENMENQEEETKSMQNKFESLHMDDSSIQYFKEKVATMEKQMNDIKRHILKVQTFAMETNLQYMELKKKLDVSAHVATSEEQMEEAENVAEILSEEPKTTEEIANMNDE